MASSHARTETDPRTYQTEPVFPSLKEMREAVDRWRVEWADGSSRETPLAGIAWYAREFDEGATVTPLTDE